MIDPYEYENDCYEEDKKTCCKCEKKYKKCGKCCVDLILTILIAALTFTVGLLVGAVTGILVLLGLPAIIVLVVILALLILIRILMLVCCRKC